jgi:hypothetical protein
MPMASNGRNSIAPAFASTRSSTTAERMAAKQMVMGSRSQNRVHKYRSLACDSEAIRSISAAISLDFPIPGSPDSRTT